MDRRRRLLGVPEQRPRAPNRSGFLRPLPYPGTKLTAFGMFQWFMPNDNVKRIRWISNASWLGISYQYNEYLRFALDSQNLLFYHNQFGIPVSYAEQFNYVPWQHAQRSQVAEDRFNTEYGATRYSRDLLQRGIRVLTDTSLRGSAITPTT